MNVEQRLAKLEVDARNWRFAALFLAVSGAIMLSYTVGGGRCSMSVASASAADGIPVEAVKSLRAHEITIVNERGEDVVTFGTAGGKAARIIFSDPENELRKVVLSPSGLAVYSESAITGVGPGLMNTSVLNADLVRGYLDAAAKKKAADINDLTNYAKLARDAEDKYGRMLTDAAPSIVIGDAHGPSGGQIQLYNPHAKCVVAIQSSKTNEGWIGVADVNGNMSNFLTPR